MWVVNMVTCLRQRDRIGVTWGHMRVPRGNCSIGFVMKAAGTWGHMPSLMNNDGTSRQLHLHMRLLIDFTG